MNAPAGERPPGFRNPRSLLLAELSALLLVAFCLLPPERMWFDHLLEYAGQTGDQLRDCRVETRMRSVLGLNYSLPREIAAQLRPGDVLLLPPVAYVRARLGGEACIWAEPKWFYAMAGPVRTVTNDNPRVHEANCSLLFDADGRFHLVRFRDAAELERMLQTFAGSQP